MKIITLDEKVKEDITNVKGYVARSTHPNTPPLYDNIHSTINIGQRNTDEQLDYLDAYESALSIFRVAAREIREEIDLRTLQVRKANQEKALADSKLETEAVELEKRIADGVMFSNQYALAFAGRVGLGMLNETPNDNVETGVYFSPGTSTEMDKLTRNLTSSVSANYAKVFRTRKEQEGEFTDSQLKEFLRDVFTSWASQFDYNTWEDVASEFNADDLQLVFGEHRMQEGSYSSRPSQIIVDSRFMDIRRNDIIGNEEFVDELNRAIILTMCYDAELGINPMPAPRSIATIGPPGCGKTFSAHAIIQSNMEEARKRGLPGMAEVFNITDFVSHYQNLSAIQAMKKVEEYRDFYGFVLTYMADFDTIMMSRNDPNTSQEEKKLNGVLFKMFDGSMIKPGKFLPIGDANFVHGMDPATKDRLFGLTLNLDRFKTPEEFAEYATRLLTKGGRREILTPGEWQEVGSFLKNSTLSNRAIGHVIDQLRGGFSVDYDLLDRSSEEKAQHLKAHLESFTMNGVIDTFQNYIDTRQKIDEESVKQAAEEKKEAYKANLRTQLEAEAEVALETSDTLSDLSKKMGLTDE